MKLGQIRAHHCAHQPDSNCPATNPETALHLNLKYYIARQLEQTDTLLIRQYCYDRFCDHFRDIVWQQAWDDVAVEFQIDSFQPDIALLSNHEEMAAIEVHVTNQVSAEKARHLISRGIPIIEVPGRIELYTGDNPWTPDQPLPYEKLFPELEVWICSDCQKRRQEEKEPARVEAYHQRTYAYIKCSRLVDFYYPSGKKYREWYSIMIVVRDGNAVAAKLVSEGQRKPIAVIKGIISKDTIQRLQAPFLKHVKETGPRGTITDNHMHWRLWEKGSKFHPSDVDHFPFRYELDKDGKTWQQVIQEEW
jgi:hypothetical protein